MKANRREFLAGMAAASFAAEAGCTPAGEALTPEAFGAKGDGRTNDTAAFAALSSRVNALKGGTIVLRPVTYIVGDHAGSSAEAHNERSARYAYPPVPILRFLDCSGDVMIRGNGAVLRAEAGLRYGYFDRATGRPRKPANVAAQLELAASPYFAMIHAEGCSGLIDISDLELDGNVSGLQIGGSGKDRWQLPATGIRLADNSGPERLSNIYTHHHPLDGLTLYRPINRTSSTAVTDLRSEFNGRQGCSITGGRNYSFAQCRFANTGKGGLHSPPGAGLDIEAGRHPIRDVRLSGCEFSNNAGPGFIADSGDSEGASFENCKFIGTTSRAAWPNKPRFRFSSCLFVGSLIRAHGDADPTRAAQFHDCRFSDDPALSPTGQVFNGRGRRQDIALLLNNPNVLFNRCRFELVGSGLLPRSTSVVRYSDCVMSQRAPQQSRPRGTYLGVNRLNGNVDLTGSNIRGQVIVNGRQLSPTAASI